MKRKIPMILAIFTFVVCLTSVKVEAAGETTISNPNNTINASLNDSFYLVPSLEVTSSDAITGGTLIISNLPSDAEVSYANVSGISVHYDSSKGLYTLSGTASAESYQTLFRSFYLTTGTTVQNNISLSFTVKTGTGNGLYYSENGHYYEYVSFGYGDSKDWHSAKNYASSRSFNERQGYLVTITSAEENAYIMEKVQADSWIGASDESVEGTWEWVTGPESGTQFWQDLASAGTSSEIYQGYTVDGMYANWNDGEPNNSDGTTGEDHAQIYIATGKWNDLRAGNSGSIGGYIVEYGGLSTDNVTGDYEETVTLNISSLFSFKFLDYNGAVIQSTLHENSADLSSLSAPTDPTRTGYTFDGWDASIPSTMPSNSVEINATYSVNQYVLSFEDHEGTVLSSGLYDYGEDLSSISEPSIPSRVGYSSDGWDVSVPSSMPALDTTLTAQYTINSYVVEYVDHDGSVLQTSTHDYNSSLSSVTPPSNPTRTGYSFEEWDSTLPSTMGESDITITATYTVNTYSISFFDYEGTFLSSGLYNYAADLSSVTGPSPIRDGYSFDGWDTSIPSTMPSSNLEFNATYIEVPYTLTFIDDRGNILYTSNQAFGDDLSGISVPVAPELEGHTFNGWNRAIPTTMENNDVEIKATYIIDSYNVSFVSPIREVITYSFEYGSSLESINYPSPPNIRGYTFVEWDREIPSVLKSGDVTITAKYDVNSYNVEFIADGKVVQSDQFEYGEYFLIEYPIAPIVEGYTFQEWVGNVPKQMGAADIKIEASYQINTYELTFNVDGQLTLQEVEYESVPESIPYKNKKGFSLSGWTMNGSLVNFETFRMPADDIELVAVYKDIAAPVFSNLKDIKITEGESVVFEFNAYDNVDGDLTSEINYSLGTTSNLKPGTHELLLSVEDSTGNNSTAKVIIKVDYKAVPKTSIHLASNGEVVEQEEKEDFLGQNNHMEEEVIWFYETGEDTHVVFDLLETEIYEGLIVLYRPIEEKSYFIPTANASSWMRLEVGRGEMKEVVVPMDDTYEFVTEYVLKDGESISDLDNSTIGSSEENLSFIIAHDQGETILDIVAVEEPVNWTGWVVSIGVLLVLAGAYIVYKRREVQVES